MIPRFLALANFRHYFPITIGCRRIKWFNRNTHLFRMRLCCVKLDGFIQLDSILV